MPEVVINNIAHAKDSQFCIFTVQFERETSEDELEILRENFRTGKIKTDPDKNLPLALTNQLCLELQYAYDEGGMSGQFLVQKLELDKCFSRIAPVRAKIN